jgi:glycosyltransferase involved in cell wall biosynthesis
VGLYGEGVNREALVALARRLRLDRVRFAGQVPSIEDVWRIHHALVLSSRAEGLPLSVLEAMACGRVPVVTAAGGVGEIVEDGVTGFVAPAATVELFADALERAWEARAGWPRMGAAAARRVAGLGAEEPGARLAGIVLDEVLGA